MRRTAIATAVVATAVFVFAGTAIARYVASRDEAPVVEPVTASAAPVAEPEAPAPALDDATIVAIFDAANTADIETGQLAAQRGASKEVREFGAMLARDHDGVRKLGRDLAARLQVTPTPPTDDAAARDHATAMTRLRSLEGPAFDRAFLEHEAAFHEAVIGAVTTTLLPAIRNEELKALVLKVAPAFEAHMLAARAMAAKL